MLWLVLDLPPSFFLLHKLLGRKHRRSLTASFRAVSMVFIKCNSNEWLAQMKGQKAVKIS